MEDILNQITLVNRKVLIAVLILFGTGFLVGRISKGSNTVSDSTPKKSIVDVDNTEYTDDEVTDDQYPQTKNQ